MWMEVVPIRFESNRAGLVVRGGELEWEIRRVSLILT